MAITPRRLNSKKERPIMPKTVNTKNDHAKNRRNHPKKTSPNPVIKRTRQVMKLYHSEDPKLWVPELTKLLDEFGIDFVCQHACNAEVYGRGACPEGHCKRPLEGVEDCTCRQAMFYNIDSFVGYRSDEEAKAAGSSMYAQLTGKKA
jgi:hypothetical protein